MPCHRKQSFRGMKIIENCFSISTHEIMLAANNVRIFQYLSRFPIVVTPNRLSSESDMLLIILNFNSFVCKVIK